MALDERIGRYAKTTTGYGISTTMSINFENAGLKPGEEFDGIVYYELQYVTKMAFLSKVFTGVVGDVPVEAVTEIKTCICNWQSHIRRTLYIFFFHS